MDNQGTCHPENHAGRTALNGHLWEWPLPAALRAAGQAAIL